MGNSNKVSLFSNMFVYICERKKYSLKQFYFSKLEF